MTVSPSTSDTLMLIDGSGFIFRAFHKLPSFTRPDGTPTGAVYGFTTMLMKLRESLPCTHAVVVFDAKGKTFRHALHADYKANRPPAPEDLVPQFPLVREAATAMGFAIIEQDGMEADDIIATYAVQAKARDMQALVVSSDKDLMQLMNQGVTLYDPMKNQYLNTDDVMKKFGVAPDKVIDVQALMGDSSDNIPGVPGIGAKTAALLIQEYGSLDHLLESTASITQKKRREMLETHKAQALLSRELATLRTDCTDLPDIASYQVQPTDTQTLQAFCQLQGFTSIVRRLSKVSGIAPQAPTSPEEKTYDPIETDYRLVQDTQTLEQIITEIYRYGTVAFDVETTSLDATQAELVGLSLCIHAGTAWYVPLAHKIAGNDTLFDDGVRLAEGQIPFDDALALLTPMLEDASMLKIGHNIKYDMQVMRSYGVSVTSVADTMLLSYVLGAGAHAHNMDELAQRHLGITPVAFKEVVGSGKSQITFDYVPLEAARDYAAEDADITLRLYQHLLPRVQQAGLVSVYERMERPLIPVIVEMERHGVKIDQDKLRKLSNRFATEMQTLEQEIYVLAGETFNIGSPKQLGDILFDRLALAKGKKSSRSGAYVTDAQTLEDLAADGHVLPDKVLQWRQLAKLKSTYTDALVKQIHPKTGRVHTSYSLATTTGRLSSSDPNLQNIPIRTTQGRLIREAFIAQEGFTLMAADYSQIELRLLAHVADIAPLKDAFKHGRDIHAATASQMFNVDVDDVDVDLRRKAKTINFGIIYGISAHGLAVRLGIDRTTAAEYISLYFEQYPGIRRYMEDMKQQARDQGYVSTLWGRRCHTPMIHERNPNKRTFAERAAINAPLQGSAADIIKRAMIAVHALLCERQTTSRMLLQVHDELVFEIAQGEEHLIPDIQRTMEKAASLNVPLVVDTGIGAHWGEAH